MLQKSTGFHINLLHFSTSCRKLPCNEAWSNIPCSDMCLVCLRNLAKQHLFQHLQLVPLYSTLQLYGFPAALSYNVANGLVTVSTWDSIGRTLHKKSTTWTSLLPQPLPYPSIFKNSKRAKRHEYTWKRNRAKRSPHETKSESKHRACMHAIWYDVMKRTASESIRLYRIKLE